VIPPPQKQAFPPGGTADQPDHTTKPGIHAQPTKAPGFHSGGTAEPTGTPAQKADPGVGQEDPPTEAGMCPGRSEPPWTAAGSANERRLYRYSDGACGDGCAQARQVKGAGGCRARTARAASGVDRRRARPDG